MILYYYDGRNKYTPFMKFETIGYSVDGVLSAELIYKFSEYNTTMDKWVGKRCYIQEYNERLEFAKRNYKQVSKLVHDKFIIRKELLR